MQQNRFCLKWFETLIKHFFWYKCATFLGAKLGRETFCLGRETFCRIFLGGNEIGDRGRHQAIFGRIQDIFWPFHAAAVTAAVQLQRLTVNFDVVCDNFVS